MDCNEKYINDFAEKDYLRFLNNVDLLNYLMENYKARYLEKGKVNGNLILFQESLNNYVIKRLKNDSKFGNTVYFQNYKKFLEKGLNLSTGFFFQNNFFHSFSQQELAKIVGKDFYKQILLNEPYQKIDMVRNINNKIAKNMDLTQDELDIICDVYAFKRSGNDIYHKRLIEYIFNNLTKPDSQLVCNGLVLDAIFSYIPKFFPSFNGFNPLRTRIVADDGHVKVGVSHGESYILMNRDLFKNTNFKSIKDIDKTYMKMGSDFTFLLIVLNHEFAHQYQNYMARKKEFFNSGYIAIKSHLLDSELRDYGNNHDGDDIEIDATEKGWEVCKRFYREFIKDDDLKYPLMIQCHKNEIGTSNRRFTYMKEDQTGTKSFTPFYDLTNLNKIISNKPEYLKKYPMLKTFYTDKGNLSLDFLKKRNICKSSVGSDYCTFICIYYPQRVLQYLNTLSNEELKWAFDNITETFNIRKRAMLNFLQNKKEGLNSEHISVDQQMDCHYLLTEYQDKTSKLYDSINYFFRDKNLVVRQPAIKDCQSLIDYYMAKSEVYYDANIDYLNNKSKK